MAQFKIDKVVSVLPPVLEPNTVYAVRVGVGFDLHFSDFTGTIAHPLNNEKFFVSHSGRVYCYSDDRWMTPYDDLYGPAYYQNAESGNAGVNPILEWEHMGEYVRAGTVVHELSMYGRIPDSGVIADMEIYVVYVYPTSSDQWAGEEATGIDDDGEILSTLLWRGFWKSGTASTGVALNAYSGPVNDQILRKFQFTGGDFICPVDGQLRIYFKPVSINPRPNNNTDYMHQMHSWLLSYK